MGKRETKQTYGDVQGDKAREREQYQNTSIDAGNRSGNVAPFVAQGRENLSSAYGNMASGGMAIGAPGQVSTGRLSNVYDKFGEIADTGGYTEQTKASILENVGGLKRIGATGGYDAENIARARGLGGFEKLQNEGGLDPAAQARMRGGGGYEEFAATGGLSGIDRANIRAKALSPISSYATGARDEMDRRRTLQNNYAPGFDAANRALSRDTSRAIADTSLNAELGITDRVNAGRMQGIAGMSGSEANLQGLRTGNMLGATQGLASAEQGMVANRTSNQMRGLESASQIESDLSARIAQLRLQGMSGQQASATAIAEIEGRNIDRGIGVEQFNQGTRERGIAGTSNLYNTDIYQMQLERDRQLALMNQGTNANLGYGQQQIQLATQPGAVGNILRGLGTAAGIGGMAFGGNNTTTTTPTTSVPPQTTPPVPGIGAPPTTTQGYTDPRVNGYMANPEIESLFSQGRGMQPITAGGEPMIGGNMYDPGMGGPYILPGEPMNTAVMPQGYNPNRYRRSQMVY